MLVEFNRMLNKLHPKQNDSRNLIKKMSVLAYLMLTIRNLCETDSRTIGYQNVRKI